MLVCVCAYMLVCLIDELLWLADCFLRSSMLKFAEQKTRDGPTNGRTDWPKDGRTDTRTHRQMLISKLTNIDENGCNYLMFSGADFCAKLFIFFNFPAI